MASEMDVCVVCGGPSNLYRFGVFCCRACCAFFRRSVAQGRRYGCRRSNRCVINQEGMRNTCRACRLRKCYEVGMKPEALMLHHQQQQQVDGCSTDASSLATTSSTSSFGSSARKTAAVNAFPDSSPQRLGASAACGLLPLSQSSSTAELSAVNAADLCLQVFDDLQRYPILGKLLAEFRGILRGQKSLYSMQSQSVLFDDVEPRPIDKAEYGRMENATFVLIHIMLMESFPLFSDSDDNELKTRLSRGFCSKYSMLHKSFLSAQQPAAGRVVCYYGYYLDDETLDRFLHASEAEPTLCAERKKFVAPVLWNMIKLSAKFRALKLREVEAAALGAILFWEHMDKEGVMDAECERRRDAMLAELHDNLIEMYGAREGGLRAMRLMIFNLKITELEDNYREMDLMLHIFTRNCSIASERERLTRRNSGDNAPRGDGSDNTASVVNSRMIEQFGSGVSPTAAAMMSGGAAAAANCGVGRNALTLL